MFTLFIMKSIGLRILLQLSTDVDVFLRSYSSYFGIIVYRFYK